MNEIKEVQWGACLTATNVKSNPLLGRFLGEKILQNRNCRDVVRLEGSLSFPVIFMQFCSSTLRDVARS